MASGVVRFSVSVSPELLKEFDEVTNIIGYDRSKAIQQAMRNFLNEYKWRYEEKGLAVGAIVLIYNHEVRGLEDSLTDIQHHYRDIIQSSIHIHLDEQNCLLQVVVKGEVMNIRRLAKDLMNRRGVKQLKLVTLTY
ncbi:MAG: nickel-responsive transcriptional regulator NikR [Nitrososphaerales archaeon]|nr:nickel-responsive transcriptional regulator NikR [Nitrososphaerales archaeon]MCX8191945.1 nickel-responsive transcriptional regulator NikR [Nitrososphaerales archaeon]